MSETKFTPGPWVVHKSFREHVVTLSDEGKLIGGSVDPDEEALRYAKVIAGERGTEFPEFHRSRVLPEEALANAALISAAPELYEALDSALGMTRGEGPPNWDEIRKVMAKARGEAS